MIEMPASNDNPESLCKAMAEGRVHIPELETDW